MIYYDRIADKVAGHQIIIITFLPTPSFTFALNWNSYPPAHYPHGWPPGDIYIGARAIGGWERRQRYRPKGICCKGNESVSG